MPHVNEVSQSSALNRLVHAEKLQLLYRQSYPAIFISMLNAILLTAILWPVQDHRILASWLLTLVVTTTARFYVFVRYVQIRPQREDVLAWERPYFVTLLFSSLVWGLGSLYIMPLDSALHQVVIFVFLIGMAGGAISVYSTHRAVTLSTIASILLPVTFWFVFQNNLIFTGMAIGSFIFFVSAVRATKVIASTLQQNLIMTHELKAARDAAEKLARIDELTGLYNRRAFYELSDVVVRQAQRKLEPLAMIMMDIDNFKVINDQLGHGAGDMALHRLGEILRQRLRSSDIVSRIGGEEFAMLLPATSVEKAEQLAENLRAVIAATEVEMETGKFSFTASFGVAAGESDIDKLAMLADRALYQAKGSGRNRVVCLGPAENETGPAQNTAPASSESVL